MTTLAAGVFGRLVRARERAYAGGWLGVARLPAPVVSVGNLSVGGSGKTPAVIALGRALMARGVRVDVLSRGYRREGKTLAVAEPYDIFANARDVGDEPLLIAQRLGAPVLVHPDRFRAGCEGERRFGSRLHLLDDGFQHRQLGRDFDLVLVPVADLYDRLLPAGRLREEPAALARASGIVLIVDDESAEGEERLAAAQRHLSTLTSAPVWRARRCPLPGLWQAAGERLFAFCGLAQPASFWRTLTVAGIAPVGRRWFRDHHRYGAGDLRKLAAAAHAAGATALVTTAKDAVKLDAGRGAIGGLPLLVVEIELAIDGLETLVESILAACRLGGAA